MTVARHELTNEVLRQAFGYFPSGVTAICGMRDGAPVGLAASSFTTVSLDPPLVSVCVSRTSSTWPTLEDLPAIGVSVLAEDHDAICRSLAGPAANRFTDVAWESGDSGAVFLHGCALWLDCTLFNVIEAGDHFVALLEIQAMEVYPDIAPMVFHRSSFRQLAAS
jgi:flavin reductase (DIM6/NTAB) family NADH-FMN oxidoreductase RutF